MVTWFNFPQLVGLAGQFFQRLAAVGVCLVAGLGLAGCDRADVAADPVIRMALVQPPSSLDPRYATDAISSRLCRLIYRGLVDFDDQLLPTADLASWQQLGPLHYRFQLLADIPPFSDGQPLTSTDVVATYQSVMAPGSRSAHGANLSGVERIDQVDAGTIDFYLKRPDPLFPGRLSLKILPARLARLAQIDVDDLVGNGAFRIVDWPQPEQVMLERRVDGQRVEFLRVADATVRALKLIRGEVDLLQNDLPPEIIDWLANQPGIEIDHGRGSNYSYIGFNLDDPVTGDLRVREAVALAIDRQAIIDALLAGAARTAESILPPQHWAGTAGLPSTPYDPERSRALVDQFVADGGDPTIVYKVSTDALRLRIAAVIQQQLQAVGLTVEIQSHEWGTFYGDIKAGRFQLFSLAWVGVKMPDIYRHLFHSESLPPKGANRGRFVNPEVDRLIEQAEVAPVGDQPAIYARLQQLIAQQRPYASLWYENHTLVSRHGISGYRVSADGNYDGLMQVEKQPTGELVDG